MNSVLRKSRNRQGGQAVVIVPIGAVAIVVGIVLVGLMLTHLPQNQRSIRHAAAQTLVPPPHASTYTLGVFSAAGRCITSSGPGAPAFTSATPAEVAAAAHDLMLTCASHAMATYSALGSERQIADARAALARVVLHGSQIGTNQ